jgi:hypothetical protein
VGGLAAANLRRERAPLHEVHSADARAGHHHPSVVNKILSHLDLPTEPRPRARARDPTGQESFDFDAA